MDSLAESKLKNLKPLFLNGSADWPNLECLLVTWAEDVDEVPELPAQYAGQNAIPEGRFTLPDGRESLAFSVIPVGTASLDNDDARFRDGLRGMFIIRRDFGDHMGGPREITHVGEAKDCGERFMYLARQAARCLKSPTPGISKNALRFSDHRRWILAVFDLCEPIKLNIVENADCLLIRDLFLESANAIDMITGKTNRRGKPKPDKPLTENQEIEILERWDYEQEQNKTRSPADKITREQYAKSCKISLDQFSRIQDKHRKTPRI